MVREFRSRTPRSFRSCQSCTPRSWSVTYFDLQLLQSSLEAAATDSKVATETDGRVGELQNAPKSEALQEASVCPLLLGDGSYTMSLYTQLRVDLAPEPAGRESALVGARSDSLVAVQRELASLDVAIVQRCYRVGSHLAVSLLLGQVETRWWQESQRREFVQAERAAGRRSSPYSESCFSRVLKGCRALKSTLDKASEPHR